MYKLAAERHILVFASASARAAYTVTKLDHPDEAEYYIKDSAGFELWPITRLNPVCGPLTDTTKEYNEVTGHLAKTFDNKSSLAKRLQGTVPMLLQLLLENNLCAPGRGVTGEATTPWFPVPSEDVEFEDVGQALGSFVDDQASERSKQEKDKENEVKKQKRVRQPAPPPCPPPIPASNVSLCYNRS